MPKGCAVRGSCSNSMVAFSYTMSASYLSMSKAYTIKEIVSMGIFSCVQKRYQLVVFSKSVSCIVATTLLIRMLYRAQAICVAVLCATCGGCWRAAQAGSGCCTCIFNSMENCVYMFRYIYIYICVDIFFVDGAVPVWYMRHLHAWWMTSPAWWWNMYLRGTCNNHLRGGWHHLRGDATCTCEVHGTSTCVVDDITCVVMQHVPAWYMDNPPAWWADITCVVMEHVPAWYMDNPPAWWTTSPASWWNMYLRGTWNIHLRGGRHHLRGDATCTCVVHGQFTILGGWHHLRGDGTCTCVVHGTSTCVVDDITCVVMEHVPAWYTQTIAYYIITCAVMKICLIILHIYIFTYIYTYLCLYVKLYIGTSITTPFPRIYIYIICICIYIYIYICMDYISVFAACRCYGLFVRRRRRWERGREWWAKTKGIAFRHEGGEVPIEVSTSSKTSHSWRAWQGAGGSVEISQTPWVTCWEPWRWPSRWQEQSPWRWPWKATLQRSWTTRTTGTQGGW